MSKTHSAVEETGVHLEIIHLPNDLLAITSRINQYAVLLIIS